MANPQVIVEFVAKVDQLKSGFKQAETSASSTGSKLKSFGKVALAAAGAAGLGALVYTLHAGVEEYSNAIKVGAQTNAVIKSTGGAAHVTAKHVDDLASSMLQKTGVDDETIKSGENLLLTFTNIRNEAGKGNDIFDRATKIMLDMSVALGQDTKQSAIQLGKALQDPIKGITALRRVGVNFTQAQQDQIKALVKSGDTLSAQKIILQELQREFGGSAEAAGKTLPGQMNILRENFNNLAGEIVQTVVPALQVVTKLFVQHPKLMKAATLAVLGLAAAMVAMNVALAVTAVVTSPITLTILAIVAAIAALAAAAYLVYTNWDAILKWFKGAWQSIVTFITTPLYAVIDWIKKNWQLIVVGLVAGPFGLISAEIIKHHDAILKAVKSIVDAMFNAVWNAMQGIVNSVGDAFKNAGQAIWNQFAWLYNTGWNAARAIWNGVMAGLDGIGAAAWSIINNIGEWVARGFSAIFQWGWQLGAWILQGAQSGISGIAGAVWGVIAGIGGTIYAQLNNIWQWGWNVGRRIFDGIVGGLRGIANTIMGAIKAPINSVISAWNNLRIGAFTIKLPGPVPDVHFGGIDLPNLPYLAAGGLVTGPTLAMLGERGPEMVLPLGTGGAPVQVRVYIGDRELTSMIRTEVITQNNRTAQTLLAGLGA